MRNFVTSIWDFMDLDLELQEKNYDLIREVVTVWARAMLE